MRRLGAFERRNETRYDCEPRYAEARWLHTGENSFCRGYLTDLSLSGASCMMECEIPKGRLCRLEIRLAKFGGLDIGTISVGVKVAGRIEREGKWLTGFEFESVTPTDMEKLCQSASNIFQVSASKSFQLLRLI